MSHTIELCQFEEVLQYTKTRNDIFFSLILKKSFCFKKNCDLYKMLKVGFIFLTLCLYCIFF